MCLCLICIAQKYLKTTCCFHSNHSNAVMHVLQFRPQVQKKMCCRIVLFSDCVHMQTLFQRLKVHSQCLRIVYHRCAFELIYSCKSLANTHYRNHILQTLREGCYGLNVWNEIFSGLSSLQPDQSSVAISVSLFHSHIASDELMGLQHTLFSTLLPCIYLSVLCIVQLERKNITGKGDRAENIFFFWALRQYLICVSILIIYLFFVAYRGTIISTNGSRLTKFNANTKQSAFIKILLICF